VFVQRKDAERAEARRLRAQGHSVRWIAAHLGVAKSSVSVWVRDVEKPPPVALPSLPPARAEPDDATGPTKHCPKCARDLPLTRFNRNGDGRQHWCRDCFRAYFRDRADKHREQSRAARERRREPAREFIRDHLAQHCCADCGEDEVLVLEFDHHDGRKTAGVAKLLAEAARLERIRAEVERCEVVCVNCHRRRTARRMRSFRVTRVFAESWEPYQRRNQSFLLEVLERSSCVDCGERDPVVLDFDHVAAKRANVSRLALGCSLRALQAEIAACQIRCSNCHRLKTLTSRPCWRAGDDHWAALLHHS
jgi:hypothetical protein